jgi:gamma-glutamyltranspeptidase
MFSGTSFSELTENVLALDSHHMLSLCTDARERAPSGASSHMFASDPIKAQDGGLAVAVLGELRGLYAAWSRSGR